MEKNFKQGVWLALLTSFISGWAVFLNKFAVDFWSNSSVFTTAKNLVVVLFLMSLLIGLRKLPELKKLKKADWLKLFLIGLIGGSIPFLLFFKALTLMPAAEAAFIHKTLFIWVAILAVPFLKEKLSFFQILALGILFLGIYLMGFPTGWKLQPGIWLALIATFLWAIENILAKHTLREVSSTVVGWGRMFFGGLVLLIYLGATNQLKNILPETSLQLGWLVLSSFILLFYILSWYQALKLAPATIVASALTIAFPITVILEGVFVKHQFPFKILLPTLVLILGIVLISRWFEKTFFGLKKRLKEAKL